MMNQYEYWLQKITDAGIMVDESSLNADDNLDGLYAAHGDKQIIFINSHRALVQKTIAIFEELGHQFYTCGNIMDQSDTKNRKQEQIARSKAYKMLANPMTIQALFTQGYSLPWELAEALDLPQDFIEDAVQYFQRK